VFDESHLSDSDVVATANEVNSKFEIQQFLDSMFGSNSTFDSRKTGGSQHITDGDSKKLPSSL
jgi:hypothetical protein